MQKLKDSVTGGVLDGLRTIVKGFVVGAVALLALWFVAGYAFDTIMSPIQAVSSWIGDKKDTVTNTAKSGAEKATEVGKTAVEKAKEGIGNLKEVGVNTFGKAKDMMSPSGVEQEPAPEESAEEADDEGKCWKRWVPFMKCPQP